VDSQGTVHPSGGRSDDRGVARGWLGRQVVALVMNLIIAGVLIAALQYNLGWSWHAWIHRIGPLKLFAIWALSFLPGWLFVRFLGHRAAALWWDFVLYLHRLGVDEPQYLPEPPEGSGYHRQWVEAHGQPGAGSIYKEKFDSYFGKSVSDMTTKAATGVVKAETLFPVFLTTAIFAVAWTAVLWDTSFATTPSGPADMLKFGFLGAYSFIIQMLMRRFFQSDLKASAYASAVLRVSVVAILIAVVHQIPALKDRPDVEAVVAFIVGFFPLVGMQALQRVAASALRAAVPSLNPAYPLNQIDGLNVWYEARLLEEGIEDMENLATANLVDVILHTHVPVGRLIDWVDQAHLYQHLDRSERTFLERRRAQRNGARADGASSMTGSGAGNEETAQSLSPEGEQGFREGSRMRHCLRTLGIRTATDLLKVVRADKGPDPLIAEMKARGVDAQAIRPLAIVLDQEPALNSVWNWQQGAAPRRVPNRVDLSGQTPGEQIPRRPQVHLPG
jgi:hypothetical protein